MDSGGENKTELAQGVRVVELVVLLTENQIEDQPDLAVPLIENQTEGQPDLAVQLTENQIEDQPGLAVQLIENQIEGQPDLVVQLTENQIEDLRDLVVQLTENQIEDLREFTLIEGSVIIEGTIIDLLGTDMIGSTEDIVTLLIDDISPTLPISLFLGSITERYLIGLYTGING